MDSIYLNIKNIRLSKNLTQEEVSKHLNMAQSNYARLERGLSQITVERLKEIADVFQMTPESILTYSDEKSDIGEDAKYYIDQVKKLELKVAKLQKELQEREEEDINSFSKGEQEKAKKNSQISELKKELALKEDSLKEKNLAIEKLEKEIEEKNKTINYLQSTNSRLLEMVEKLTRGV